MSGNSVWENPARRGHVALVVVVLLLRGYEVTKLFAKKFDFVSPDWFVVAPHEARPFRITRA